MAGPDVAIVGAGPVGATLAALLANSGLAIELYEARPGPSRERRVLALSHASREHLEEALAWPAGETTAIDSIHISQKGGPGRTLLEAREQGLPALGYTLGHASLEAALAKRLEAAGIAVRYGQSCEDIALDPQGATIHFSPGGEARARLLVLADGGANAAKIPRIAFTEKDYAQQAVVAAVEADRAHAHRAYERFTPEGPVALLPFQDHFALVWTAAPGEAKRLLNLDEAQFLSGLQAHFGDRAGRFTRVRDRASFPLRLRAINVPVALRTAIVGNAAQALHPIAGQGLNLGLRDAAALAAAIASTARDAVGGADMLAAYRESRRRDASRRAHSRLGPRPRPHRARSRSARAPRARRAHDPRLFGMSRPRIVVAGAGPVGLALACACEDFDVEVIEGAVARTAPWSEEFDLRVYAVSPGTRELLRDLGAWEHLDAARLCAVRRMEIFGDEGARLAFSARPGTSLAWIVEAGRLAGALESRAAAAPHVNVRHGIALAACGATAAGAWAELEGGERIAGDLLVGADGPDSRVRALSGIAFDEKPYGEAAVVANFATERDHGAIARQWFRSDGVLAWLPLPGKRISIVWSAPLAHADEIAAMDARAFERRVREAGLATLGDLELISQVARFPLRSIHVPQPVAAGVALVGDAAHVVHPLAGQGVNLGFQDACALAAILAQRSALERPGDLQVLRRYARARREDVTAMQFVTDGLERLFSAGAPGVRALRNLGLRLVDGQGWAKRSLARQAMR